MLLQVIFSFLIPLYFSALLVTGKSQWFETVSLLQLISNCPISKLAVSEKRASLK